MRDNGLDWSSCAFEAQTETLVALGHGDQCSRDPIKDCVTEYLGKQMSKRTLPNAPRGELVWQQADRPQGLASITHSSGYHLIRLMKILISPFVVLQNPLLKCWVLQNCCLPLFTAPPPTPQSSIFHLCFSRQGKLGCRTCPLLRSTTFCVDNWRHLTPLNQNGKILV